VIPCADLFCLTSTTSTISTCFLKPSLQPASVVFELRALRIAVFLLCDIFDSSYFLFDISCRLPCYRTLCSLVFLLLAIINYISKADVTLLLWGSTAMITITLPFQPWRHRHGDGHARCIFLSFSFLSAAILGFLAVIRHWLLPIHLELSTPTTSL